MFAPLGFLPRYAYQKVLKSHPLKSIPDFQNNNENDSTVDENGSNVTRRTTCIKHTPMTSEGGQKSIFRARKKTNLRTSTRRRRWGQRKAHTKPKTTILKSHSPKFSKTHKKEQKSISEAVGFKELGMTQAKLITLEAGDGKTGPVYNPI